MKSALRSGAGFSLCMASGGGRETHRYREGRAGREAVRQGEGQRPRSTERNASLYDERLVAGVRIVKLRRPRLPRWLQAYVLAPGDLKAEEGTKFTADGMG